MAREAIIFERGGLTLAVANEVDPQAVDLLCKTVWGSPGGARYLHLDTRERITQMLDPYFLQLHKGNELMGVLAFSGRDHVTDGLPYHAWYIRYFAMKEAAQRKGQKIEAQTEIRESLLKRSAKQFFDRPGALQEVAENPSAAFFAYVTLDNPRSRNMCDMMGFTELRQFKTFIFSRLFPKRYAQAAQMESDSDFEKELLANLTPSAFQQNALIDPHAKRWVWRENGVVCAGLQTIEVHWKVAEMPGLAGWLVRNVIPFVPLVGRLMHPQRFQFLAVDAFFCKPGHAHVAFKLLEHALAAEKKYTALMWRDLKDAQWAAMLKRTRLGFLERFNHAGQVSVIAKGLSPEIHGNLAHKPIYVRAADVV